MRKRYITTVYDIGHMNNIVVTSGIKMNLAR
jgi:hypothetical protein